MVVASRINPEIAAARGYRSLSSRAELRALAFSSALEQVRAVISGGVEARCLQREGR